MLKCEGRDKGMPNQESKAGGLRTGRRVTSLANATLFDRGPFDDVSYTFRQTPMTCWVLIVFGL